MASFNLPPRSQPTAGTSRIELYQPAGPLSGLCAKVPGRDERLNCVNGRGRRRAGSLPGVSVGSVRLG